MKVQVEIEIPDDCEICEGPVFSSALWNDSIRERPETGVVCFHVVIRRAWQWPSWLLVDWVARCRDGLLAIGFGNAVTDGGSFQSERGSQFYWLVDESMLAINLPHCPDWKQSLRINPNREANP